MNAVAPARTRVGSDPVVLSLPPVPLASATAAVVGAEIRGDGTVTVSDVAYDSRLARPGCLFCCIPGATVDGHDFAAAAAESGAAALVVERWLDDLDLPQVRAPSVREAMGPMSAVVFGRPAEDLTMAAVTGTNGKTTCTYLFESVFRAAGLVPGVIGTTGARIDGHPAPIALTTPEAPDLQYLLARMRSRDVTAVAMEASSHALEQHRVGGIVFDVAVFTNLSQDHLDYHPSMGEYFDAKAALFTPEAARHGVVNADDPRAAELLERSTIPTSTFGLGGGDLRATEIEVTPDGLSFRAGGIPFRSSLRGRFNVWNCLAVISACRMLGIGDDAIAEGIASLAGVPGRMEPIDAGQEFLVMVDYAHTPESILAVLQAARPLSSGRVIVVFGSGGDRDREKRPSMGAAATAEADLSVITSDNPRSEDPMSIIAAVESGARGGDGAYVVEPDRRAAIRFAIHAAKRGDVVVIAGRGHETHQELADDSVPFDDREVAREELAARGEG
jgi:UDP-N-acetylmuramoyl-L-alanyl-D-glutamate--2,6-diaminopimelate ligase